ncbi:MAG: hypothetical protein E5W25_05385 [Mesorhizobium sp.]|nr:MAG: hypothetical protein E5W25_05385 [Mesorhizobium sp.]
MRQQLATIRPQFQSLGRFRGVLEMIIKKAILAVLITAALAGCETQTESQQRATTGALVGGASLKAADFLGIAEAYLNIS